ncbi:MAG: HAD family hydrolase [Pirellulaceae bacterium]
MIICDVGSTVCRVDRDGKCHVVEAYVARLQEIVGSSSFESLHDDLRSIETLRLQEQEKQGRFKLSYYTDAARLQETVEKVLARIKGQPFGMISSVDPFNGDGLIDLLPANVSKAFALRWWCEHLDRDPMDIIFAGDSGNDLAVLTAGYRAIVVGNADRSVVEEATISHRKSGWSGRLHVASASATSGVLEGCRFFGLIATDE